MLRYITIYKPFQVLSQFSSEPGKQTLSDLFRFEKDCYPVGRLDYDSEGLLLITNDRALNHRLLNPGFAHDREYWVQVEGSIDQAAIERLENGVDITVDGKPYHTKPAAAKAFNDEPRVPDRNPPIRFRKSIPTSWISLTLTEGKNRQVRKMTASVGFPTLRLIRYRISSVTIEDMKPGDSKNWDKKTIYDLLNL